MVYNNTISDSKENKQQINTFAEKVSSSGGDNKLRAYLFSDSDDVVNSNEDTLTNSNGNTITNSNINMSVEA